MNRAWLLLFACLGCSGRRDATKLEPVPPAAPATTASASPDPPPSVADAGSDAGEAPANVGRFRSKVVLEPADDVSCMATLLDFDVLPNGQAWFVGGCGIRFRIDGSGKLEDFRVPPTTTKFLFAGVPGTCDGTASFWGVWARSEREAFVVGDTRCGLDPNTIWYRPLERFDGKKWLATRTAFGKGSHEGIPFELGGNDEALYTLVEGDDWHGPPECAVHRFVNGAWGKAELECPAPKGPNDRVMVLKSMEVTKAGTLWVVGHVLTNAKPTSGMVWTRAKGQKAWTEIAVDDVELASVSSADGSVVVGGRSLWQLGGAKFTLLSTAKDPVTSVWVGNEKRIWLVRNGAPFVWIEGRERPVAIEPADGTLMRVHGAGAHVWAAAQHRVWQLSESDGVATPQTLKITEPKTR